MPRRKERTFGPVIRERRRQLDLTQQEVAQRVKTSTPYIGHLESGKRHPSDKVLARLAEVLGLDLRELFFLANPRALEFLRPKETLTKQSAWEEFRKDARLLLHPEYDTPRTRPLTAAFAHLRPREKRVHICSQNGLLC